MLSKNQKTTKTDVKTKKPASFPRTSGVLMHISSLPGPYGIGTFGKEAKKFVDLLAEMGISYWQTLPFGPIDGFNSPYQSFSAFAGNPFFIDPETLYKDGLLTREELETAWWNGSPWITAYDWLRETRIDLFRKAFARIDDKTKKAMDDFAAEQAYWLPHYALCVAISELKEDGRGWPDWKDAKLRSRDPKAVLEAQEELADETAFQIFLQYEFYTQWEEIKKYANYNGVYIIGDLPIYVSVDSSDVWTYPELFDLDSKGRPKHVAGVPPDYFSEDGQLWGNPVYDWQAMKKQNYKWWIQRLTHALDLFDTVRIDHFRSFSAYWAVPYGEKTAKNGEWKDGPGMDFFNLVFDQFDFSRPKIIAEDLGVVDDGVINLLKDTGFPGMRVMQFAFISLGDNIHYPHNYLHNMVAYTGTHDNNTLLGFLWEIEAGQREYALDYVNYTGKGDEWQRGGSECTVNKAFIRTLWQSPANLTIVPIQDLCGYGADAKMNKPGTAGGNWVFRITDESIGCIDKNWVFDINRIYQRLPKEDSEAKKAQKKAAEDAMEHKNH